MHGDGFSSKIKDLAKFTPKIPTLFALPAPSAGQNWPRPPNYPRPIPFHGSQRPMLLEGKRPPTRPGWHAELKHDDRRMLAATGGGRVNLADQAQIS